MFCRLKKKTYNFKRYAFSYRWPPMFIYRTILLYGIFQNLVGSILQGYQSGTTSFSLSTTPEPAATFLAAEKNIKLNTVSQGL